MGERRQQFDVVEAKNGVRVATKIFQPVGNGIYFDLLIKGNRGKFTVNDALNPIQQSASFVRAFALSNFLD